MKTLLISAVAILGIASVASAATTVTLTFDDASEYSQTVNGNTALSIVDPNAGSCGGITAFSSSFLCATRNGSGGSAFSTIVPDSLDLTGMNFLTVSFDYSGTGSLNQSNGNFDNLDKTDWISVAVGGNELFSLDGRTIQNESSKGSKVVSFFSQTFAINGPEADVSFLITSTRENIGVDNLSFSASVPEPSTWLTMLAGFALTGAALKRRKVGTVAA